MRSIHNISGRSIVSVLLFMVWLGVGAYGYPFAGGSGTSTDPFQVTDVNGLIAISENQSSLGKYYLLLNDIIFDPNADYGQWIIPGYYVSGGGGGRGRGPSGYLYGLAGCIDGGGHVIINLPVPLINFIEADGQVRNLGLRNVHIDTPATSLGGLALRNQGTLQGCYVQGQLAADGLTGGLVGINEELGTITECYANVSIQRAKPAGGLVGAMYGGRITRCYSMAHRLGDPNESLLPLVGQVSPAGAAPVAASYFLFDGLPASPYGTPLTESELKVRESFAGWDFYGLNSDGIDDHWFMPADSYPLLIWQAETGLVKVPDLAATPTEQAENILNAAGLSLGEVISDYDRSMAAGTVIATSPRTYAPVQSSVRVLSSLGRYNWQDNAGHGSAQSPYEIFTAGQLLCVGPIPTPPGGMQGSYGGTYYLLTDDLDMSVRTFTAPPVVTLLDILDGDGHAVTNLVVTANGGKAGLFGTVSSSALVTNLTVKNAHISGVNTDRAGALAGLNAGIVQNCHATGTINASGAVGGLIGENEGLITACDTEGTVTSRPGLEFIIDDWGQIQAQAPSIASSGGLVGVCKKGMVFACRSDAEVFASGTRAIVLYEGQSTSVGGLIGQLGKHEIVTSTGGPRYPGQPGVTTQTWYAGEVVNSYATGLVSSDWVPSDQDYLQPDRPVIGALVGNIVEGNITNCYTTGAPLAGSTTLATASYFLGSTEPVYPGMEPAPRAVGLTEEQMRQRVSFVGWDFDAIWTICEGLGFPRLWWEKYQCPQPTSSAAAARPW